MRFPPFSILGSKVRHLKWAREKEQKLERFHLYARPLLLIHYNIAINSPLLECLSIRLPFAVLCCAVLCGSFYFAGASIAKTLLLHSIGSSSSSSSNMLILFRIFDPFFMVVTTVTICDFGCKHFLFALIHSLCVRIMCDWRRSITNYFVPCYLVLSLFSSFCSIFFPTCRCLCCVVHFFNPSHLPNIIYSSLHQCFTFIAWNASQRKKINVLIRIMKKSMV